MLRQRTGGREGKSSAGTDSDNSIIGLDDVAVTGKNESALVVRDDQQGLQMAKSAVLAPFLGEFDGGFLEIARKLLQFAFEAFEQGDGVGGGAGESGDDLVIVE